MYLAMISIYNKLIENSINLTISNFILQTAIISSKVNFPIKKQKQKKRQIIVLFAAMLRCPRAKIQLKNDIFFINKKIL